MQYRILANDEEYYLQIKKLFHWVYARGYNRGAPGSYNYQIDGSSNPFYLVEHEIPDIEHEHKYPTITIWSKMTARIEGFFNEPNPRHVKVVYTNIQAIKHAIDEHREIVKDISDPYPSIDKIEEAEKSILLKSCINEMIDNGFLDDPKDM